MFVCVFFKFKLFPRLVRAWNPFASIMLVNGPTENTVWETLVYTHKPISSALALGQTSASPDTGSAGVESPSPAGRRLT